MLTLVTRKYVVMLAALIILSAAVPAMGGSVKYSKHNFAPEILNPDPSGFAENYIGIDGPVDQVCSFCHTPHGSNSGAPAPLWNRSNPIITTYTPYSSPSFTLYPSAAAPLTGMSLLCMSCHDGVTSIAVGSLLNPQGDSTPGQISRGLQEHRIGQLFYPGGPFGPGANIGGLASDAGGTAFDPNTGLPTTTGNLADDHPVAFSWVYGLPGIKDPATWGAAPLRLFNISGLGNDRMECSTCHAVHDPDIRPFLRMDNSGSQMCLTCHDK